MSESSRTTSESAESHGGVLRAIIEGTTDAVFVKSLEGRYILVNTAFTLFLGRPASEIVGRRDEELYPPDTSRQFVEDDLLVLKDGRTQVFEGTACAQDGTKRAYRVTKGVYRDGRGEVSGIFGISHDITDHLRAEEERVERVREQAAREAAETSIRAKDELVAALRDSEERYRSILENASDIIYSHDLQGRYLSINRAGELGTGYTREDILSGMNVADVVAPEHLELTRRMTAQKLRGDDPILYEVDIITKAGKRLTLEVNTRVAYEHGRPIAVEGIARDVTERKRADAVRELLLELEQKAREEAEEANRMKDQFLATLSHELRTPLTSIIGWIHLLRSGEVDAEMTGKALETISRSAHAQKQLIDDLLDVSRAITGKITLDPRPISLKSLLDSVVASMLPAAQAKNVTVENLTGADVLVAVLGDADRLRQVVWNLLSNAIKFTDEGGTVQVRLERVGGQAELTVRDTGQGIAPHFLPNVFDRFQQADQSTTRRHGGLGLGLAIVRHLVELHGGTVRADSAGENQGSMFTVRLPLIKTAGPGGPAEPARIANEAAGGSGGSFGGEKFLAGVRVLVVDDDEDAGRLVAMALRRKGAEVLISTSAEGVPELIETKEIDVLVSDIGMPGEDGYSLIRRVRALRPAKGADVPALAFTAYAQEEDREKALRAGFQAHVTKPASPDQLAQVVARLSGKTGEA